jgi:hypothetical protein
MSSRPRRKLVLFLAAIALIAVSFIITAPRTASALPNQSCLCSYYNSTYTVQVGERDTYCNGYQYRWGVTSQYAYCDCESCFF